MEPRIQQIMAYETDLLEFSDIFKGSEVLKEKMNYNLLSSS